MLVCPSSIISIHVLVIRDAHGLDAILHALNASRVTRLYLIIDPHHSRSNTKQALLDVALIDSITDSNSAVATIAKTTGQKSSSRFAAQR